MSFIAELFWTYSGQISISTLVGLLIYLIVTKSNRRNDIQEVSSDKKDYEPFTSETAEDAEECSDDDFVSILPEDLEHVPYKYIRISDNEMIRRSEQFYEQMNGRRTVRFFSQEPVPEEVIRNIVKTAGTSPSGAHTEPWTFVVVKDPVVKKQIREIVEEEEYVNYTRRMGRQWTTDLKPFKTNWNKPYLTDAPYLILVFKQLYSYLDNGARKNHYYNEISIGIASGMLLMAIHNAGLVTLTSTPLQCGSRLRDILGRPDTERLTLLFPVGLPSQECTVPNITRKPLHDICIEI